jgi:hypothetical protein
MMGRLFVSLVTVLASFAIARGWGRLIKFEYAFIDTSEENRLYTGKNASAISGCSGRD